MAADQQLFWVVSSSVFVRAIHCGLTLAVVITFFIKNTEISQDVKDGQYLIPIIYIVCVIVPMNFYFLASLSDPGYVNISEHRNSKSKRLGNNDDYSTSDEEMEEGRSEASQMLDSPKIKLKKCSYCKILQPMRVKHCRECKRCVHRFDHHCPWLDNCVGERNHRYFWLFLLTETALIMWSLKITWSAFKHQEKWEEWLQYNLFFIFAFALLLFGLMVAGLLLGCHSFLIAVNTTTWEFMSRQRIQYLKDLNDDENPFDEGLLKNFVKFLFYCALRRWELMYYKNSIARIV
ncbi:palmitoyltransferase ZDHHC12-B-like [Saccoglossus kowalevskii]|uniref:Palmitoyltransferase n=1 Tax=Saccoglossus kowalevskii TaxID=10224 RepID=A0ABM0GT07_SACKO|nr:PREDICTED: probable palmitoyltransferase ZDHHC12-like [Saccoglossus kowalevskii]